MDENIDDSLDMLDLIELLDAGEKHINRFKYRARFPEFYQSFDLGGWCQKVREIVGRSEEKADQEL